MEDKIVLYSSPTCGVCNMLKTMLANVGINFEVVQDIKYMRSIGILQVPILEVNGDKMKAREAIDWINGRNKKI